MIDLGWYASTKFCTVGEVISKIQPQKLTYLILAASMVVGWAASDLRAWNIPGHMLSGAIAYQILQRQSPTTIPIVRSVLEKHPWYEIRWKAQLEKLPDTERD